MSGSVWGISEGYSLMIGGKPKVVEKMRPIFETLAPAADKGWGRVGPHSAGHFVKMIHNGIEYGMMQALAEEFNIMKASKRRFQIPPRTRAPWIWNFITQIHLERLRSPNPMNASCWTL